MKNSILFYLMASSIFLYSNVITAQERKIKNWNAQQNVFISENHIFQKSIMFDSIGIWGQLGPANNDIIQFEDEIQCGKMIKTK
nr:hypothetical protein [Bacteroidota bacterium]